MKVAETTRIVEHQSPEKTTNEIPFTVVPAGICTDIVCVPVLRHENSWTVSLPLTMTFTYGKPPLLQEVEAV